MDYLTLTLMGIYASCHKLINSLKGLARNSFGNKTACNHAKISIKVMENFLFIISPAMLSLAKL